MLQPTSEIRVSAELWTFFTVKTFDLGQPGMRAKSVLPLRVNQHCLTALPGLGLIVISKTGSPK